MNNFTSMVIAILEKSEVLTEDEAKKLAKELHSATLPDNYQACALLLDNLFKELGIKSFTTKISLTKELEDVKKELADLTAKLEGVKQSAHQAIQAHTASIEADLAKLKAKPKEKLTVAK